MGPYDYGGILQSAYQAAGGGGSPFDTPPDDGLDRLRRQLDAMEEERKRRHAEAMQRAAAVWRQRGQRGQQDTVQAGGVEGPYDYRPPSAATRWVPS